MTAPVATYSFLPWLQQGLAATIDQPDTGTATLPPPMGLTVSVQVDGSPASVGVQLYGPGDVTGLDSRVVLRTDPLDGSRDSESTYFATVELTPPSLPWLFTPATAGANRHLRPWICLVVVPRRAGISLGLPAGQTTLALSVDNTAAELPDLADAWMTAHVQVAWSPDPTSSVPLDVQRAAALAAPGASVARLLCLRKLRPSTAYHACIVPTFDVGRRTGLGVPLTPADLAAYQPAWSVRTASGQPNTGPTQLPVYYHWEFTTGPDVGDFSSMVAPLQRPLGQLDHQLGGRGMDVSAPGYSLPGVPALAHEAALQAPTFSPTVWPTTVPDPFQTALRALLNRTTGPDGTPIVAPPIYGSWYAQLATLPATGAPTWLTQLNLDPRHRVAAALGTLVVQAQQEALMASAWDQLAHLRRVNQLLRQAQLAREVSQAVLSKHFGTLSFGTLVQVTRPVHARTRVAAMVSTVHHEIGVSIVPDASVSPVFRRVASPQSALGRRLRADGLGSARPPAVERFNIVDAANANALRVSVPRTRPDGTVVDLTVSSNAGGSYSGAVGLRLASRAAILGAVGWTQALAMAPTQTSTNGGRDVEWDDDDDANIPAPPPYTNLSPHDFQVMVANFRAAAAAQQEYLTQISMVADGTPRSGTALAFTTTHVLNGLSPATAITAGARQRIGVDQTVWQRPDPLDPLVQGPSFPQAMFGPLAQLVPEFVLPGLESVPPNTVAVVQSNARFMEAYMVGLNHEMTRELLWREFPTSRQATYFQHFWRSADASGQVDIPPIAGWSPASSLGSHSQTGGLLLLLVRSDLLRRYPRATLCVERATAATPHLPDGTEKQPLVRLNLNADTALLGFDLPLSAFLGLDGGNGWYFVAQEHPGEPRFGLLAASASGYNTDPASWDSCTWGHLTSTPAALDALGYVGSSWPRGTGSLALSGLTWGGTSDAAQMASILMRDPMRVAVHGSVFR